METTAYNKILSLFIDNNEFVDWRNAPFRIGDQTMSTNGHAIAIINDTVDPEVPILEKYDPKNVLSVIPKFGKPLAKIHVDSIKHALSKVPMVPEEVECKVCQGEGEVEYHFDSGKNVYTEDLECPVCKGDGCVKSKSGLMQIDISKSIKMGVSCFGVSLLDLLVKTSDLLDLHDIIILAQEGAAHPSIFRLGKVDLLIMPMMIEINDERIIGSIPLSEI